MARSMPVVRQIYWPALVAQFGAISLIAFLAWLVAFALRLPVIIFASALLYLGFCKTMRYCFARQHKLGIRAYRSRKFAKAIECHELSYQCFCRHPKIDRYRALILGSASATTYRVMALCNIAFCHAQLNDGARAVGYYEMALREDPECTLAQVSLRMLHSMKGEEHAA
jgi:hypothetical protein